MIFCCWNSTFLQRVKIINYFGPTIINYFGPIKTNSIKIIFILLQRLVFIGLWDWYLLYSNGLVTALFINSGTESVFWRKETKSVPRKGNWVLFIFVSSSSLDYISPMASWRWRVRQVLREGFVRLRLSVLFSSVIVWLHWLRHHRHGSRFSPSVTDL